MKHGRLFLASIGLALVIVGIVAVFLPTPVAVIGLVMLIGLVAIVLAGSDWTEFEAELRDFKVKISTQAPAAPSPSPQRERRPELRILSLRERGGGTGVVDFSAEVANEGARQCRAQAKAHVDETPVQCHPETLDLATRSTSSTRPDPRPAPPPRRAREGVQ